ncbi:MAG: hypothetical protein GF308_08790 [Candidatus Heimdallarchaeota archaeon]|nr:hypothetical protein [Candidatus Heimdallarchaeota archaeon]
MERKASHALKVVLKLSLAVTKTKETICPSFQNLSPYETQKLRRIDVFTVLIINGRGKEEKKKRENNALPKEESLRILSKKDT